MGKRQSNASILMFCANGVGSIDKAWMLHLKGLGLSPAASSPPLWAIYKSNVNPLWDLGLALALVWSSLLSPKLIYKKKKILMFCYLLSLPDIVAHDHGIMFRSISPFLVGHSWNNFSINFSLCGTHRIIFQSIFPSFLSPFVASFESLS